MFWAPPPPPPVSYSRDVAPIMAMHCNGCHGEAGAFSTRTYERLMAGGNLGKAIVPGDPAASLLMHFILGLRGEQRRMPAGGAPLSTAQIATLTRWIAEGATGDPGEIPEPAVILRVANLRPGRLLRLESLASAPAYLTIRIVDRAARRLLWSDEGAVKSPKDRGDLGEPGCPVIWDVRIAAGWPDAVEVELVSRYAPPTAPLPKLSARPVE